MSAKKQLVTRRTNSHEGISFERLYGEFISSKKGQIAPATVKFYHWNLKALKGYMECRELTHVEQMDSVEFRGLLQYLLNKYPNHTTINAYLRATRAFLNYAMKEEYIGKYDIHLVREPEKAIEVYTIRELSQLFKTPINLKKCCFTEHRNWIMVQYLAETGNRLNSIINRDFCISAK